MLKRDEVLQILADGGELHEQREIQISNLFSIYDKDGKWAGRPHYMTAQSLKDTKIVTKIYDSYFIRKYKMGENNGEQTSFT